MADKTRIEWSDATWNPLIGCSILSSGCTNCYAMRDAWRIQHNPKTKHYDGLTHKVNGNPVWTGEVRMVPEVLDRPLSWRRPRRVFVNSMSDLFHEKVPDEWIDRIFAVMALAPQHRFQVLTKRADRLHEYMTSIQDGTNRLCGVGWRSALIEGMAQRMWYERHGEDPSMWLAVHLPLPNVWIGVSAENQLTANERLPHLEKTPAAVRFLSAEPLLGDIDLNYLHNDSIKWLDWVIVGGESGPKARPMHPQWARWLRDTCNEYGVPYFFKQWGRYRPYPCPGFPGAQEWLRLRIDGSIGPQIPGAVVMESLGKAKAGRELDGREWNEIPAEWE